MESWRGLIFTDIQSQQTYIDLLQGGYKQMRDLSHLAEGEAGDGARSLVQGHGFTVAISGDVALGQNYTAICEACPQEKAFKTKKTEQKDCGTSLGNLPMAMKLRFSCTPRQDTSVGLLPGMAGNILVHRGVPLSFLSRFQTFTCKCFFFLLKPLALQSHNPGYSKGLNTYQRIYSMLILSHRNQDAVLLQLVEVRHPQLVGLKWTQLQGTG